MQKAQITDAESVCIACSQSITNPLCPECLAEEIREWLKEKVPSLAKEIITPKFTSGTKCIRCGSPMGICAHCYVSDIYTQLWEITPILANDFLETFNFEH